MFPVVSVVIKSVKGSVLLVSLTKQQLGLTTAKNEKVGSLHVLALRFVG